MWFTKKPKVTAASIDKKINDLSIQFLAKFVNNSLNSELRGESSMLPVNYGFKIGDNVFTFFSKCIYTTLLGYDNSIELFVPGLANSTLIYGNGRQVIFDDNKLNKLIVENNYGDTKEDSLFQKLLFTTETFLQYGKFDTVMGNKLTWYASGEIKTIKELIAARDANPENTELKEFAKLELDCYNLDVEIAELEKTKLMLQEKADSLVGLYFEFYIVDKDGVKNTISINYHGLQNHVKIFIEILDDKINAIKSVLGD